MTRKDGRLGIKDYKDLKTWSKGKDMADAKGWICLKCGEKFDDEKSAKAHQVGGIPNEEQDNDFDPDDYKHIVTYR